MNHQEHRKKRNVTLASVLSHTGQANSNILAGMFYSTKMQWKGLSGSQSRAALLPSPAQYGLQQSPGKAPLGLWSAGGCRRSRLPSLASAGMLDLGWNIIPILLQSIPLAGLSISPFS